MTAARARRQDRFPRHAGPCLIPVLAIAAMPAPAIADAPSRQPIAVQVGLPEGFSDLAQPQQSVVDVYFGDRRIAQAEVRFQPGQLTFTNVDAIIAALPDLADPTAVRAALAQGSLDTHPDLLCSDYGSSQGCGRLDPAVAGIIFDQDHFRVSIFVNPRLLKVRPASDETFLPRPDAPLSLIDSVAGTVAGGTGSGTLYAIQNRAVLGDRDARLISTTSYASGTGLNADTLVAQLDKPGLRYSAGVFWAPGIDLIGRRKMLGAGIETQLDTRYDKDLVNGSPLIVSLSQRSRVDLLNDGRLMSSRIYEAGNQSLDTSGLPDGSYEIMLRIQEIGGGSREERRFFTKNPHIAPTGQPLWFVHGGVLVDDRADTFLSPTNIPYVEGGMARRLTQHLALDTTVVVTRGKAIAEAGGYLITQAAQFRLAVLGSTKGDKGALFQINASGRSALNYNVDIRRIVSHDDRPLVRIGDDPRFDRNILGGLQSAQLAAGTFTQAIGSINYRLKAAQISLSGFYRQEPRRKANYAFGPTARWSVYRRHGLDITLDANLSQSNYGRSAFVGFQLMLTRPHSSIGATSGAQTIASGDGGKRSSIVGGVQATWQRDDVLGSNNLMLAGNLDHTPDSDLAHLRADMRGPSGTIAADVVQQTSGEGSTQYSLGFQTSTVLARDVMTVGGREQSDSMIVVRLKDGPSEAAFQVIVNETPRGVIHTGETLPIAVTPYRQYGVRIRPISGTLTHFDNSSRLVSVYPGNVASLEWTVRPVVAMFGRAVWPDGSPVIDADITAPDAIGHTDGQGYFQIEASAHGALTVRAPDGRSCRMVLNGVQMKNGYAALGTIGCATASHSGAPEHITAN